MAQLSDAIESFIKAMMQEGDPVELRRNELAQHFGCAPSQINYVLATRFSVAHGYLIESRRGGGGYVRIVRIQYDDRSIMLDEMLERVGTSVDEETADAMICCLREGKMVTENEADLIRAAVGKIGTGLNIAAQNVLRAEVLRNVLIQVFRNAVKGELV